MKPFAKLSRGLTPARVRLLAVIGAVAVLLLTAISCKTVSRAVVVLPNVPGANYIGSRECEQCHEELYRDFASADHARLITQGKIALNAGCESCHGPASLHAESGGEVKTPNAFTAGRPQSLGSNSRLGMKASTGISESVCFECHANVRGEFNLPHHHPVPEGRMTCTECHSPHKGNAHMRGGAALLAQNDNCLTCHAAQRGPHVFQHEAMREGCATCHKPHGSVNAKMLTVRDSNLCLKCHFQQQGPGGAILIGGSDHRTRLSQGTCWTAGCHEAVHGSRVNSSLRF